MEQLVDTVGAAAVDPEEREGLAGLRATIELAAVGIAHFDRSGRFLFANRYLCRMLGYTPAELTRRTFQELTHPEDLESCLRHCAIPCIPSA